MATGKITKRSVEAVAIPPAGRREHLWDETLKGFGVMVTEKGVRSYLIQYRLGGRGSPTRRVTIGRHGSPWTAEKARSRAADLLEQVRQNIDPYEAERERLKQDRERKADEEAARDASAKLGFAAFADRFIDRYARVKQPRSWRDTESVVRRDLKPHFGDTLLTLIRPAQVVELLETVQERGDGAAIKAYRALRGIFGYAVDKHVLPASPMAHMKPPASIAKRARALTDTELRLAWLAAKEMGYPFGTMFHALILTGQRLREVAEAPWTEFNIGAAQWLIPADRAKNEHDQLVALAPGAAALFRELPRIGSASANGKSLFAFTTTGNTPVSGFSKAKARLDALMLKIAREEATAAGAPADEIDALKIEPWRIHDFRRTLASGCQRLGVKLEVSEAILNHVSGTRSGIVGVYHVYRYEDEKQAALEAWDLHVASVTKSTKAVLPKDKAGK